MEKLSFNNYKEKLSAKDKFSNLLKYTDMVVAGIQPSLLVTGGPGSGKTFKITERLKEKGMVNGRHFFYAKGRASTAGLYVTLYNNHDKLIVFDDCDSVFKDKDAVNLLKAALDSYDTRSISYMSARPLTGFEGEKIPTQFDFTGQIIFISNLSENQIDSALRSRSFTANIDITQEQMLTFMGDILEEIEPEVKMSFKTDAFKALKQASEKFEGVELNMRSLVKAIRIRKMGFDNWQWMVAEQCMGPISNKASKSTNGGSNNGPSASTIKAIKKDHKGGMNKVQLKKKYGITGYMINKALG